MHVISIGKTCASTFVDSTPEVYKSRFIVATIIIIIITITLKMPSIYFVQILCVKFYKIKIVTMECSGWLKPPPVKGIFILYLLFHSICTQCTLLMALQIQFYYGAILYIFLPTNSIKLPEIALYKEQKYQDFS